MKKKRTIPVKRHRTAREMVKIYGSGFFVALVILILAYQFVEPAPPHKITIATAGEDGAYYNFAQQYRSYFFKENIDLQVLKTSGSVENLQLLADHSVEVAFVQGGVGTKEDYPKLRGLASVYLEPLWICVRKGNKISTLSDLAGMKIAVGAEGSGTRQVSMQLLRDNGLLAGDGVETVPLNGGEGVTELLRGDIDALFVVGTERSSFTKKLLRDPRISLVSLQRAESYSRLHHYLAHVVLPEGVLDMKNNIPAQPVHLLSPAATLVMNDTLHPALIDLLMQVVTKVHRKNSILGKGKHFPSPENLDFPLSKEARRFYKNGTPFLQRYLPFWAASLIDRLKVMLLPLIALILPLMKVLPPTYRWRMRSRIYRWYEELHELDIYARENASPEVISEATTILDDMEHEVRLVEVPLSFAEELYNLRVHIDLLRKQLRRL